MPIKEREKKEDRYLTLHWHHHQNDSLCIRMATKAVRAILMFIHKWHGEANDDGVGVGGGEGMGGEGGAKLHKTMSINHSLRRERRAEASGFEPKSASLLISLDSNSERLTARPRLANRHAAQPKSLF